MKLAMMMILILSTDVMGIYFTGHGQGDLEKNIIHLRSNEKMERESAAKAILQLNPQAEKRQMAINEVKKIAMEFITVKSGKGTAKTAISLLGDLHAEDSVPFLVDNLTFEVFYFEANRPQTKEDQYPCVGSLIKIGQPSIEPTVVKAERTEDDNTILLSGYVVEKVLKDKAKPYLTDRIGHQADPKVRQKLLRMLRDVNLWYTNER
jgi:hypothetical protein